MSHGGSTRRPERGTASQRTCLICLTWLRAFMQGRADMTLGVASQWAFGWAPRFGLYAWDHNDPEQVRSRLGRRAERACWWPGGHVFHVFQSMEELTVTGCLVAGVAGEVCFRNESKLPPTLLHAVSFSQLSQRPARATEARGEAVNRNGRAAPVPQLPGASGGALGAGAPGGPAAASAGCPAARVSGLLGAWGGGSLHGCAARLALVSVIAADAKAKADCLAG